MIVIANWKKFTAVIFVILVIVTGLIFKLLWGTAQIQKSGEVTIAAGEPARSVWAGLANEGYTPRSLPWKYYGGKMEADTKLKVGTYVVAAGETVKDVIQRFIQGDTVPDEFSITYPEGFTLEQIATRTASRGIGTKADFIAAAEAQKYADTYPYLKDITPGRSLEGYLFPDTYQVFEDDTAEDIVRRMLGNFNQKFTEELRQEAIASGRTIDEIVIMASIIEREVISDEDMATVADVLWKRIDEGIGLYADATTRYYLNKWDGALTANDLAVDSEYNTRRYRGLPPTPISNPGMRAITAAVRPKESPYYYYLSAPSGETIFAETNDEHNRNKAEYLR